MQRALLLFAFLCAVIAPAWSGSGTESREEIRSKLLPLLQRDGGAAGTEFYFSFPPCYEVPGAGNSLVLYIAAATRTRVLIEVEGRGFQTVRYTLPNDVIEVIIAPGLGQAYSKGPMDPPPIDQVWPGAGMHVKSSAPIVVYGVTRFQYTSDSFLAYPVHTLGKQYIISSMADMTWMYIGLRPAQRVYRYCPLR
ncbi:MAG: hypothetical protein KatS3mg039_1244 [Candidatus Kapaibacterium sp.]|nr:MAG: hypothetical protein KatS3mg039_1244 [Candidatus Kapabacteria bacterium]